MEFFQVSKVVKAICLGQIRGAPVKKKYTLSDKGFPPETGPWSDQHYDWGNEAETWEISLSLSRSAS